MIIKSLNGIPPDVLFVSFSEAFKDYGRVWNKSEFEKMLFRRGFVPELSFGAFDDDRLVSFTLNGIGEYSGKKTAYDTGTGTIESYRGSGLATKILEESLPYLRQTGIEKYLLEVLQNNTKAISIYEKAGFTKVRELNYFIKHEVKDYKLMPMENGQLFLPVKAEIRKRIGKNEGDWVHVTLYPDNTPTAIPDEFLECLQEVPETFTYFHGLTNGQRKDYVDWIYAAKTNETKIERITKALDKLGKGEKLRDKEAKT